MKLFDRSSSSSSSASVALCSIALVAGILPAIVSSAETEPIDSGCSGGTCPSPTINSPSGTPGSSQSKGADTDGCGLWMGPSPIKKESEHGFGLGIFTGKAIPKGTAIESVYGHGELLLPFFGCDDLYDNHPPLREFTWSEGNLPETAVEYPFQQTALFVPGLASIAPCTSENHNLRLGSERFWSASSDDGGVHRATHPHAGAFSYRHNVTYIAVRDIAAGEELTVFCDDDSFDGGAYFLNSFESQQNDDRVICLDQNLKVDKATMKSPTETNTNNKDDPMGLGLIAKRNMAKGEAIISSPMVPTHRKVLDIIEEEDVNDKQLMLNYVFGHPDSDLLLLPYGPMVNFINHKGKKDGGANAEIRWHHLNEKWAANEKDRGTEEMLEYHDTRLFDLPGEVVADTHGRGLVMDIVAIKDIAEGEEVYLDYGDKWQAAWDEHSASFKYLEKKMSKLDREYVSAENFNKLEMEDFEKELQEFRIFSPEVPLPPSYYYRTEFEEEDDPYPENMEFFCYYEPPDVDQQDEAAAMLLENSAEEGMPLRYSWFDHLEHSCLRHCAIMERYTPERPAFADVEEAEQYMSEPLYNVVLFAFDNPRVVDECVIPINIALEEVPHSAIRLLDRPFTTDVLNPYSFRHEIGVPEGFYPQKWMAKKSRLRKSAAAPTAEDETPEGYKKTKQNNESRKATA
eukprot:CAMPEP_0116141430 /NCGR_PEP_ID=MMETSP0329-20121206/14379_1 /TAXON_ID=697910 /ORGANISM="Pseudo-nitzschia arenysensis, Strain B593" /LENGTH=684 /DNA_ID=CAMNT_0003636615 /DNA_START=77 /DNA_END=2131 /DNA_ORIENTATION=-